MKPDVTLVCCTSGDIYQRYAQAMWETAEQWFFPEYRRQFLELETTDGWPLAARDRYTHMLQARRRIRGNYVVHLDADSLFEGVVDDEIMTDGITIPFHRSWPAGTPRDQLPYERNPASAAYIPFGFGNRYYVTALVAAPRKVFFDLCRAVDHMCWLDGDYSPVWQDESYINKILLGQPPALELDDRYMAWTGHDIPDTRIRAISKTPEEFAWRENSGKETASV